MKQHHKDIIKFIFQPITKPATCVAKEVWEMITVMSKCLVGDDGADAWGIFACLMGVILVIFMITSCWLQVVLWKTGVALFITSYCTLYYVRDYRKRKKNES